MTEEETLEKLRAWKQIFSISQEGADIVIHGNPGDERGGFAIWRRPNASQEFISALVSEFKKPILREET